MRTAGPAANIWTHCNEEGSMVRRRSGSGMSAMRWKSSSYLIWMRGRPLMAGS